MDLARENWNYIFSDLVLLCERLEELDIETVINNQRVDILNTGAADCTTEAASASA